MEGLGETRHWWRVRTRRTGHRFVVKNFSNENDIIQELETRLIVDLSEEPNLYTQIAGISGIPQVNRVQTEYAGHLKNGYVLSKGDKELWEGDFYWNCALERSLVYSIEKYKNTPVNAWSRNGKGGWKNVMDKTV